MNIQRLLTQIPSLYPFDLSYTPILLREGIDNDVYIFRHTNGNKVVLRISKRDVSKTIDFETKLQRHFFEHQVPVAELLPTNNGNWWGTIDGVVVIALSFVPGKNILVKPDTKPDTGYAVSAGKVLGQLHTTGLSFSYNNSERRTIFTEYQRALLRKDFISKLEGGSRFLEKVESYLKWAQEYKGNSGIIHNDYIPGNVLFNNLSVSAVVDFDWACRGPLIKDLGIALAEWSLPDGLEQHWKDIFTSFLEGYNESAPEKILPDSSLYKWICYSCLSDACTFFSDLPGDSEIKSTGQCRRYNKFLYFEKDL